MQILVPSLPRTILLACATLWIVRGVSIWAQTPEEFPIATTATPEFSLGLAFDGTNYLVGLQGVGGTQSTAGAQLLSQSGNKIGPVISTGRTGRAPFVAYGGGQYLIVWADDPQSSNTDIWGMLIAPNGTNGSAFPISTDAEDEEAHGLAFDGSRFLVGYARHVGMDPNEVFGRFVTPSGIVDSELSISTGYGSHGDVGAIAFNGSNYLVAWCEDLLDQEIRARLVAPNGALGIEVSLYSTTHPADGGTTVVSDGSSFLVVWAEETGGINTNEFDIQAQLVDAAGALSGGLILIASGPHEQGAPFAAFDGANYLVTYTDFANDLNDNLVCDPGEGLCADVAGRLVSRTGALVGSAFPVTSDPGDQYVSPVAFGSSKFLCAWTSGPGGEFLGGDVYGAFLADPPFGNVLYKTRIADGVGGLQSGTISVADEFAKSIAPLGDLDGDGIGDLAAGAAFDNDGPGIDRGAVYVLFLNRNGSARSFQKISDTAGGFTGGLDDNDIFGFASASIGDLDGDSIGDLAIGAPGDDDSAGDSGAVWVLFLNANGTVKGAQKISNGTGGFTGTLLANDEFGASLEGLGDLDGDGVEDLAVGAHHDDDGGTNRGAVWILFLNTDGTVKAHQKISDTAGSFAGTLADGDELGRSVATLGDFDGVGGSALALAVGAALDDQSGSDAGAVWVLFLGSGGGVSSFTKITEGAAGFGGDLDAGDRFGVSVESLGDVGGPGLGELAVGASRDDDGGTDRGAVWVLSLDAAGSVVALQKISATSGNFGAGLADGDSLGVSIGALGDLDRDGRNDMAVGAFEQTTSQSRGAVWICFLNDGTLALGASATTWTGATSTQWELASNWGNGTPSPTKTAIIPDAATTPRDPSITLTGQQCNSLWIQSGGTLDVSAGADSLGVFGGATVSGPITGTGELVFDAPGTLAGDATIGLSFTPFAVRAEGDLGLQGGPLSITGSFAGNASVSVASTATIDIAGTVQVASNLAIDGSITIGDGVMVGGTLSSSSSGELVVMGNAGACVVAGQVCFHGEVVTSCSLSIERLSADTSDFEITNGWPAGVSLDAAGTVNLLTANLVIGGDFLLQNGTLALGVDSRITTGGANGIQIADADVLDPIALLDVREHLLQVPAPEGITVGNRGKLNVGAGGELQLAGTLTVESGGSLCLDGVPADRASLTSYLGNRYALALNPGSTLAAKGFAFRGMTSSGIVIGPSVTLAAAPFDLRGGLLDDAAPGGVLLDIERPAPTQLRYLRFDNSLGAAGITNVRTTLAGMPITLVNWSGDLAPDAASAELFDDDPGESSPPERIVWAPPESSDVQGFTASWGPSYVRTTWHTLSEVDSESFLVQRSPEPPTLFTSAGGMPSTGPGSYELRVYGSDAFAASRYRLYERLTHGELGLIDEVMLPASGIVLRSGGKAPAPPALVPQPIVVGPGGTYPDVPTALVVLARSGRSSPVTLELARGTHEPFEIGRGLAFDLCLVARPGAVIDAARSPMRIEMLSAERALELVGLVVDARRGLHPALEVENARGVVLLQDVRARGGASAPALRLVNSTAVVIQGGAIEDVLALESRSRATASGTRIRSLELAGRSALETRGASPASFVEPGSTWLAHAFAPRLRLSAGTATLEAEGGGLAWLGLAHGLGFTPSTRPLLEGLLLLEPTAYSGLGPLQLVLDGRASWQLDPVPPGVLVYLQAFVLDPYSGGICLSDVVRGGNDP